MTCNWSLKIPLECEDGTPAHLTTDMVLRNKAINSALFSLLCFYKQMAVKDPKRDYRPYEAESMLTLPIIPRIKQQWNQGDAYFLRNNYKPYPLLDTWKGIRDRCFDPNSDAFDYYGALPHVGPLMEECYSGKFPFRYNLVAYLNFCIMIETVLGRPANENETLDKMSNVRGYGPHNLQWLDKRGQAYNRCNGKMHLSEQSTVEIRLPNISDATIKPPWTGRGNKMIMASRGKTIKPLQFKSINKR